MRASSSRNNERTLEQVLKAYAQIPPVQYSPPVERWDKLPKTRKLLTEGGTLHVVMLGRQHRQRHQPLVLELHRRAAAPEVPDREDHVRARLHRLLVVQVSRPGSEVRARSQARSGHHRRHQSSQRRRVHPRSHPPDSGGSAARHPAHDGGLRLDRSARRTTSGRRSPIQAATATTAKAWRSSPARSGRRSWTWRPPGPSTFVIREGPGLVQAGRRPRQCPRRADPRPYPCELPLLSAGRLGP